MNSMKEGLLLAAFVSALLLSFLLVSPAPKPTNKRVVCPKESIRIGEGRSVLCFHPSDIQFGTTYVVAPSTSGQTPKQLYSLLKREDLFLTVGQDPEGSFKIEGINPPNNTFGQTWLTEDRLEIYVSDGPRDLSHLTLWRGDPFPEKNAPK